MPIAFKNADFKDNNNTKSPMAWAMPIFEILTHRDHDNIEV